jgi:hypothetical protein
VQHVLLVCSASGGNLTTPVTSKINSNLVDCVEPPNAVAHSISSPGFLVGGLETTTLHAEGIRHTDKMLWLTLGNKTLWQTATD